MKGDPAEVLESHDGVNVDGEAINGEVASEGQETSARSQCRGTTWLADDFGIACGIPRGREDLFPLCLSEWAIVWAHIT